MESQMCIMPERCLKCGLLFDFGYELELTGDVLENLSEKSRNAFLCWKCREL